MRFPLFPGPLPPGSSWYPALPQSSTDPHHVTGPGKMRPAVAGRADGGLSVQGSPAAQEAGPAASGSLRALQARPPASAARGPSLACSLEPLTPICQLQRPRGCGCVPRVAAHPVCDSNCSPFLCWPHFSCGDAALGLPIGGRSPCPAGWPCTPRGQPDFQPPHVSFQELRDPQQN